MFIRKREQKSGTYYYLCRYLGEEKQEALELIGRLDEASPAREMDLIRDWGLSLLAGANVARQKQLQLKSKIERPVQNEFDFRKCYVELTNIHRRYGSLTKTLLEKEARPKGELSWGTQTLLNNFKKRSLTLAEVFEAVRRGVDPDAFLKKNRNKKVESTPLDYADFRESLEA